MVVGECETPFVVFVKAALCTGDSEDPFEKVRGLFGFGVGTSASRRIVL